MNDIYEILDEISEIQSEIARNGRDYANHTKNGVIGVLGTGHALGQLGEISASELECFRVVGEILLAEQPAG